jgi:hypothetical protein
MYEQSRLRSERSGFFYFFFLDVYIAKEGENPKGCSGWPGPKEIVPYEPFK